MLGIQGISSWVRTVVYASLLFISTGYAQQEPAQPEPPAKPDANDAVWQAAGDAMQHGPQVIELSDQGRLSLPQGYSFVPKKEAAEVMRLMGNQTDERFLGLVLPDTEASWMATVDYEPAGYIKDDDAKDWDAEEMLEGLKEGTKAGNEQRRELGIEPIEVTKWVEVPTYDSPQHRLVWSVEARMTTAPDPDPTINYNTYVLGREGYISLNMITSSSQIEKDKAVARELLWAVEFNEGKRYTDFNASTDKVAAYGLAALVGGLAAKKLGLLAAAGIFLAKFAKIILIGVAALAGLVAKKFMRSKSA
jgi:uncharacterized membrane-anchored protein